METNYSTSIGIEKLWKWILANKEAINKLLESQINICFTTPCYQFDNSPTGGLPIHYRAIAEELANRGHKVTVISFTVVSTPLQVKSMKN